MRRGAVLFLDTLARALVGVTSGSVMDVSRLVPVPLLAIALVTSGCGSTRDETARDVPPWAKPRMCDLVRANFDWSTARDAYFDPACAGVEREALLPRLLQHYERMAAYAAKRCSVAGDGVANRLAEVRRFEIAAGSYAVGLRDKIIADLERALVVEETCRDTCKAAIAGLLGERAEENEARCRQRPTEEQDRALGIAEGGDACAALAERLEEGAQSKVESWPRLRLTELRCGDRLRAMLESDPVGVGHTVTRLASLPRPRILGMMGLSLEAVARAMAPSLLMRARDSAAAKAARAFGLEGLAREIERPPNPEVTRWRARARASDDLDVRRLSWLIARSIDPTQLTDDGTNPGEASPSRFVPATLDELIWSGVEDVPAECGRLAREPSPGRGGKGPFVASVQLRCPVLVEGHRSRYESMGSHEVTTFEPCGTGTCERRRSAPLLREIKIPFGRPALQGQLWVKTASGVTLAAFGVWLEDDIEKLTWGRVLSELRQRYAAVAKIMNEGLDEGNREIVGSYERASETSLARLVLNGYATPSVLAELARRWQVDDPRAPWPWRP